MKFKLNNLLEVIYENEKGYIVISMGRLYDYSCKYISLDMSKDYWELENTVTIPRDKIKKIRKVNWELWR